MKHELLLSEAILQGAKSTKQIRYMFQDDQGGACVTRMAHIGGCDILERIASQRRYVGETDSFISTNHWAWYATVPTKEVCGCNTPWEGGPKELVVAALMAHLNDVHQWTPTQIAEWVAGIEKKLGLVRQQEHVAQDVIQQPVAVFA